ncbi:MAG: glycosyltransferase family 39 protein [Chitinophagales bacterium]
MDSPQTRWKRFFAAGLFVFAVVVLVNRQLLVFSYQTNLGGVEEIFAYYAQRFSAGLPLYIKPNTPPYFINQYGPLNPIILGTLIKLFGGNSNPHLIFVLGRVLSLCYNLATSVIIYKLLKTGFKQEKNLSAVAALLTFLVFYPHNYALRPDSLKTLLVIASFYTIVLIGSGRTKNAVVAALLLALAIFTKQDSLVFLPLFGLYLFIVNRASTWRFTLLTLALVLFGALAFHFVYGAVFTENIIRGLSQGVNFYYFEKLLSFTWQYILILALSASTLFALRQDLSHERKPLFALGLLASASLVFGFFSCLKWGSAPVYFCDALILNAIFITNAYTHLSTLKSRVTGTAFAVLLIGLLLLEYTSPLNKLWYKPAVEEKAKASYAELKSLAGDHSLSNASIICMAKEAEPFFMNRNLFPTYEAEFAEYYWCQGPLLKDRDLYYPHLLYKYPPLQQLPAPLYILRHAECNPNGFLNLSDNDWTATKRFGVYELDSICMQIPR